MDPEIVKTIQFNRRRLNDEITEACNASHRSPDAVTVVTVSKYVNAEITAAAVAAGCGTLGENRPQQIWEKSEHLDHYLKPESAHAAFNFHMIGHLQRNKVRRTLPLVSLIHSVDSIRLLNAINTHAKELEIVVPVLVEINITGEKSKTGLAAAELPYILDRGCELANVEMKGLMGMASLESKNDFDLARRDFASIRELFQQERQRRGSDCDLEHLSMGMSNDFGAAIAEGSTMIRVGSRLFEGVM